MEIIRIGVTTYPGWVEPCVLKETDLFHMKCKSPGIAIKILQVLQLAVRVTLVEVAEQLCESVTV